MLHQLTPSRPPRALPVAICSALHLPVTSRPCPSEERSRARLPMDAWTHGAHAHNGPPPFPRMHIIGSILPCSFDPCRMHITDIGSPCLPGCRTDLNAPETGLLLDNCRGAKFVVIAGDVVGGAKTDDKVRECMPDSRACMQGSSHKAKLHLKYTFLSHRFVEDKTFILMTSPCPCVHGPPLPSRADERPARRATAPGRARRAERRRNAGATGERTGSGATAARRTAIDARLPRTLSLCARPSTGPGP